jgi:hypothetical protein
MADDKVKLKKFLPLTQGQGKKISPADTRGENFPLMSSLASFTKEEPRRQGGSMSRRGGGRGKGRGKRSKRDEDDGDWKLHEEIHGSLEEEHSSVESVEEDEEDIFIAKAMSKKRSPPIPPKDKEEASGESERPKRSRRLVSKGPFISLDDDPEYEVYAEGSEEHEDDEDQADEPRVELVTAEQIAQAATTNIAYLDVLVKVATYYRSLDGFARDHNIDDVDWEIRHTLSALRDYGMPITQAGPVEHAVPPSIPMADGSELRFTNVAQELGIIWKDVPLAKKEEVYQRAADLHREVYGCLPKPVKMHTSTGLRPVNYYNEHSYGPTMRRALLEFRARERNAAPKK